MESPGIVVTFHVAGGSEPARVRCRRAPTPATGETPRSRVRVDVRATTGVDRRALPLASRPQESDSRAPPARPSLRSCLAKPRPGFEPGYSCSAGSRVSRTLPPWLAFDSSAEIRLSVAVRVHVVTRGRHGSPTTPVDGPGVEPAGATVLIVLLLAETTSARPVSPLVGHEYERRGAAALRVMNEV